MLNNTTITNLKITKKPGLYGDYFLIYNHDDQNSYFVFQNKLRNKALWNDLEAKFNDISKIWLEFEETPKGYKVINFDILESEADDLFL